MLSPRKQNRSSPTKQNLSPTHTNNPNKNSQKQQKYLTPELLLASIHELQSIILGLGGRVPSHLQYGFDCGLSFIRVESCEDKEQDKSSNLKKEVLGLKEEIKNLKIKLSNYQFEVKKLEEDTAQFKLISKMQKDKQIKKLKAQITKLQLHVRQDNNKWQTKISEMRDIYENNMNKAIKEKTEACERKIKEIKEKVEKQSGELRQKYEKMIKQIKEAHKIEVNQLKTELQVKLAKKQEVHVQEIEKIRVKNVQIVQKLQKKQQQIITSYDCQKKVQTKKQDQQKISANKLKQKLYNDLYLVRRQKQQLNKKILQLKTQILQKSKQKQRRQLQIKQLQEIHKLQIQKNQVKHLHEIQKLKHETRLQIKQICQEHDNKLQEYQNVLQKLEEIKLAREEYLQEANIEVYKKFESRPSKVQDTTVIQKLNFQLLNKEEALNSARFQLKQAKLQRQNNQKNYTRLFSANPYKQREIKERFYERPNTASQRQRIYKQANTIDMSFLLKACNKNF